MRSFFKIFGLVFVSMFFLGTANAATTDDLVFIHHSVGENWLANSLNDALLAETYIDERNDITYGTDVAPDSERPDSLGPTPGDNTDMQSWILWFNDYLTSVKDFGSATGTNKIIMYKSCFPNSGIPDDGTEPGDPFSDVKTITNYQAIYRHPDGTGNTYSNGGYTYSPLEDIFADNPNTLFIVVTAPPLNYGPTDETNDADAHRARVFNDWLKGEWLDSYNTANPTLHNVAVFDLFDFLAYADDDANHPNRLKEEYGGNNGDSHPNDTANEALTASFTTDTDSFLDTAWAAFAATRNDTPSKDGGGIDSNRSGALAAKCSLSMDSNEPRTYFDLVIFTSILGALLIARNIVGRKMVPRS